MAVGPITIFDKSALQALNLDEAVLFDNFYLSNITPLFLVETLADLDKIDNKKRRPEDVVGNLAAKTPIGGIPNVHHLNLCAGELLESPMDLRFHRPIAAGGRHVSTPTQDGIMFGHAPEAAALERWQSGEFLQAERLFARQWRRALSGVDLQAIYEKHRPPAWPRVRDLADAKSAATRLLFRDGNRLGALKAAMDTIQAPPALRRAVTARWKSLGGPKLTEFAPYTAHVLTVDLFFNLAIGSDLIDRQRPSHRIDLAYLYYLPFCMMFVSGDRLHQRMVPCFLTDRQAFVWGPDLKADLVRLDAHYSALPDDVRAGGLMSFAANPPTEGEFLTTQLWDRFLPRWRSNLQRPKFTPEGEAKIREIAQQIAEAKQRPAGPPPSDLTTDSAGFVTMETRVPAERGKWRILPPEYL